MTDEHHLTYAIAGITASGKSALALALARHLQRERGQTCVIINADSAQVYRDLQILSARPTADEMDGIEHRLFGYVDGSHSYSAAHWAKDARLEIAAAHDQGAIPILVGGTGLYLRTLIEGIAPIPEIDADIRAMVRQLSSASAYAALQSEDPEAAARLNPADRQRIGRALEIIRATGTSQADWQADKIGGIGERIDLRPLILLPPRDWLYQRCDRRFEQMIETGGLAEARKLAARSLDPDLPVMRAIGVPEMLALSRGELDREQAIAAAQLATRRYAKRQYTWFRNQPPDGWPRWQEILSNKIFDDIIRLFQ